MVDVENAKLLANQLVKLAAESRTKLAKITKKVSNKEMPKLFGFFRVFLMPPLLAAFLYYEGGSIHDSSV